MQSTSDTLAAAIVAQRRDPVGKVTVDFARSGTPDDISVYAASVSIERTLTTDVPDGTRLVTGYAASTATVDLGGAPADNDHDGAWTWAPTNTDSPFYAKKRIGAPVTVKLGFTTTSGDEMLTRFTGTVRTLDTDGSSRAAELQAIDGSDRLRAQVLLPMATNLGHPGLDGRFFIDYILTANGIVLADCDLEDSLNPLTATPYTSTQQNSWTLIQQIAAAEYATAFFDAAGKFHFWNRQHFTRQVVDFTAKTVTVNGVTSPIPQISSTRALKTLTTTEAVDSVMNHVSVAYQPLSVQTGDWIWQSTFPHGVHSKGSETIGAIFDNPVQSLATDFVVLPIGGDSGGKNAYRANTEPDGTGRAVENLTFTLTQSAQKAEIVVHNPNSFPAYLVEPRNSLAGHLYPGWSADEPKPTLMLWGRAVIADPNYTSMTDGATGATADTKDQASIDDFGEQAFTVDAGGWVQDADTAATLAQDLLGLLARPIPYLGDVDVVADPRLELGDRIELVDETGTALDQDAWIVGITDTFDAGSGYSQTLTLRMTAGIGSMIWDDPVYGKWDTYAWDGVY